MSRTRRLVAGIGLSLAVHGAGLFFAEPLKTRRESLRRSYRQKIVVRMVPATTEPRPTAVASRKKAGKAKPANRPQPSRDAASSAPPRGEVPPASYGDLLPGLGNLPLAAASGSGDPAFAPPSQAAAIVSDAFAGKLDIPLFFRDQGDDASATAKIEFKEESPTGWWFAYISGDPLLRAVLYEALRDPANATAVADLFRELKSKEVLISLRQRTVRQPDPHERFSEAVRLEGSKLVVERTLYRAPPLPDGSGGGLSIPLPDEEAKRAIRRDKARLDRFTRSPAYMSPLRERLP